MSQQNNNNKYYDIHCIECGEIFKANELTFNIDELLKKHADYIKREKQNNNDYDVFKSIKLGMNYSKKEVEDLFGRKKIETKDIRDFFSRTYGIDIEVVKSELEDKQEVTVPQPRTRRRISTTTTSISIPNELLAKYKKVIKFRARDIDSNTKEICYEQLHKLLSKDEVILEIEEFEILEKKDDRGNSFPDKIKYTLSNGHRYIINELSCPHCGGEVKGSLGEHKQFVIGMIGSARVGKTAYLASLVDRLDPEIGNNDIIDDNIFVKIGESGIGKKTFSEMILKAYRNNTPIPKTPPVNGWVPVFCLEISINNKQYIFTFVDMPGEVYCREEDEELFEFQDEEFIMNTQRIITNSHMLWFCIDPSQIDPVIQKREREIGIAENADKVVLDIHKLVESIGKKLDFINNEKQNAAILITKSDKIDESYNLIERRGQEERLTNSENGMSVFLVDKHKEHTKKVYSYVGDRCKKLINSFEDMFDKFNIFAIASYGINLSDEKIGGRKPSNVEHPFLWTCAVLDILSGQREITTVEEIKEGRWPFTTTKQVEVTQKIRVGKEELFFHK